MTVSIVTHIIVDPDKLDLGNAFAEDITADVLANEPGTIFYQFYRHAERPNEMWAVQTYRDEEARKTHLSHHKHRGASSAEFMLECTMNFAEEMSHPLSAKAHVHGGVKS